MTQAMHQILIVEDEPAIRDVLRALLGSERYRVIEADTAARAEVEARSHKPDLLLIDLGLPDSDGIHVIRQVRGYSPLPIIVLSARSQEEQKIVAFDAGADDYVTKPFSAPELLARVRAALRRGSHGGEQSHVIKLGRFTVDLSKRETHGPDGEIHLTPLEYRVLECLARQTGLIVMQNKLIGEVWGPDRIGDTRSLRVCMKNLRQKLEADARRPQHLITEAGLGYRLRVNEEF
jgi:two-component system KDP operon response regulator KdpE